ncbi:MAG: hypothetical protein U0W24_22650 [Bacteroidales bacterium]
MNLSLVNNIARYEMKTLLRSWFFRIFAGMAVFGLCIFNLAMNIESSGAPWIYRALPAAIPYANLIILNLGQAIVAIFLASEFLKQDRKNDTVEVIYSRSMTNGEYIAGKTIGILLVFFILNVLVLIIGIGFSFLSNDSSSSILSLLVYPLLISLPTLFFIFGLSFFLMILLKNQAVTFLVLLGYIALTVFYLNQKFYHVFDFIAYHVPMMYSSISGFGNLREILLHRGIFLMAGIALIFITIYKLPRLPQSRLMKSFPLITALFFLVLSGILTYSYVSLKAEIVKLRTDVVKLNNRYSGYPKLNLEECEINLQHKGETINVTSILKLKNLDSKFIDTIILRLNPSLVVGSVSINSEKVGFKRELHLVKVKSPKSIKYGDSLTLVIDYHGNINENICFIDDDPTSFKDNFTVEMFNLRKRYAFIQNNFVCLTSDALWYPEPGPGYADKLPLVNPTSFKNFRLKVKTEDGLIPVSQGKAVKENNGNWLFTPEYPLTRISLVIGNYIRKSLTVDSVEYNLYTIAGHQYYESYFSEINDTLQPVIRGLRQDFELQNKLKYPFKRFSLVEVPVLFALDLHSYNIASEAVQPEMVFYPEKGSLFEDADFRKRKKRTEEDMKRNNEEILPEDLQVRMLQQCIRQNLMAKAGDWDRYENVDANTWSAFPLFYNYSFALEAENWPGLDFAFTGWMKEKAGGLGSSVKWFYQGLSKQEKINIYLQQSSMADLMKKGIENEEDDEESRVILKDILLEKGIYLFDNWSVQLGEKKFDQELIKLIEEERFSKLPVYQLDSLFGSETGNSISADIEKWYSQDKLAGYLIKDIVLTKVLQKENQKFLVTFMISNPEAQSGIVEIAVELDDKKAERPWWEQDEVKKDFSKKLFLPAGEAREVNMVFSSQPRRMEILTFISRNLPAAMQFDFEGIIETRKIQAIDTVKKVPLFVNDKEKNEIVVDNDDAGFSVIEAKNQAYLKSILTKKEAGIFDYNEIRFWNIPLWWSKTTKTGFYGKYVHSAVYTKSGQGERIAKWQTKIPTAGYYDVYFHYFKTENPWRQNKKVAEYHFNIIHENNTEKLVIPTNELENGWNFIGSWYFSGVARVELSNQSGGEIVVADAIKWVLTK